jgi:hypothetical protein
MLTFSLRVRLSIFVVLAACGSHVPTQAAGPPAASRDQVIARLIDQLPHIGQGDVGYTPAMTGTSFLPLGKSEFQMGLLGAGTGSASTAMRELVKHGAAAVPFLIAHLDDKRPTKITMKHEGLFGGLRFRDEYDWNSRTEKQAPAGVNRDPFFERGHPTSHTVTVGDLCYVALGQIVNREFNAVRYQPTAIIVINSPTYSEALQKTIKKEWGKLTPASHRASLVRDFLKPDTAYRSNGAALRLGYYYPDALEPLALKQFAKPCYDSGTISEFVLDKLFKAGSREERKALLDAFVKRNGKVGRDGVLVQLFGALYQHPKIARLRGPTVEESKARECLVELFGYGKGVRFSDQPDVPAAAYAEQAYIIEAIAWFPTARLDQVMLRMLRSTPDNHLAIACAKYLVGRGVDAEIQKFVRQRQKGAKEWFLQELLRLKQQFGWTALHVAARRGQQDRVEQLLRQGADVNAQADNGQTPLHVAVENEQPEIVRCLLKRKANPNIKDQWDHTPVQSAVRNHFDDAVKTLLANGAEVRDILVAACAGREDLVKAFLTRDRTGVNARTSWGETPLHLAATYNHVKVAEALLAHAADVNASSGASKITPLHRAAFGSGREMLLLLLKHKADPGMKDYYGKTPLEIAEYRKDEEIIRLLKKAR